MEVSKQNICFFLVILIEENYSNFFGKFWTFHVDSTYFLYQAEFSFQKNEILIFGKVKIVFNGRPNNASFRHFSG